VSELLGIILMDAYRSHPTRKELEVLREALVAKMSEFSFLTHLSVIPALSKTIVSELKGLNRFSVLHNRWSM
jgi:hypothetical protein